MINLITKIKLVAMVIAMLVPVATISATSNISANNLLPKIEIFTSPKQGTFLVGSTFEVPVYINTRNNSVNTVSLKINFDQTRLSIVSPSGGKSIFGIWVESPTYDNNKGLAQLTGVIPGGIVTSSGLLINLTFKAISSGEAFVAVSEQTTANLNDGLGSEPLILFSSSRYFIDNPPPDGVLVTSETHPFQDVWYNNNNATFMWKKKNDTDGFSVVLDSFPTTIPESKINNTSASVSFENIVDGVSYVHIKPHTKGVWGPATHFQVKIDTSKPADFKPEVTSYKDEAGNKRFVVSYFTTDQLSGVDKYEIGVINTNKNNNTSPVFIQAESPFVVPIESYSNSRVLIRVFDKAGNIKEEHVDLHPGISKSNFIKKYGVYFAIFFVFLLLLELIFHYLFGHHILGRLKSAVRYFNENNNSGGNNNTPDDKTKINT